MNIGKYILIVTAVTVSSFEISAQTPRISFTAPLLYPEGVAYHEKSGSFYVSSVKTGSIGSVDARGNYKLFYEDTSLRSSFGMKVDTRRNKLWICTADPNVHYSKYTDSGTFKKVIRVIGLDLNSGKKTDDIDLSQLYEGKHFANDMALDDAGNIYITDSYSPVIYKIDTQMKPALFAKSDWFKSGDVGLNGIAYSPQGYLVVANNSDGSLFKVDLKDPQKISKVKLKTFFPGADGLLWDNQNNLVLIQNKGVHKIFQLSSSDNWQTAEVKASTLAADRFQQPTTGVLQKDKIYVLNSKLNELSDPTAPPSKEFSLQLVKFTGAE